METPTDLRLDTPAPYPYPDREGRPVYLWETDCGVFWIAAEFEADALEHLRADPDGMYGPEGEQAGERWSVAMLSADQVARMTFDDNEGPERLTDEEWADGFRTLSFRAALARFVGAGESVPGFFATTEY